ncbi:hypothetical protein [Agromyces humi]|uniref:hypothetical protein n=1 Tax=Agromyces humi TaxID=1766800 RepID=UPI00135C1357|nr:hypothetical protein [Agromyces humi]
MRIPNTHFATAAVTVATLTVLTVGTAGFAFWKLQTDTAATDHSRVVAAESRWRADVTDAVGIRPGERQVTFVVERDGRCIESLWQVKPENGRFDLALTETTFGVDGGLAPTGCLGTVEDTSAATLFTDIADADPFGYENVGGRTFTRTGDLLTLDPVPNPAGISEVKWSSSAVKRVSVHITAGVSLPAPSADQVFVENAPRMSVLNGAASGTSTFVAP